MGLSRIRSNLTDDGECTSSFAIKSHVFGVALSQADVVAIAQELTHSESVTIDITWRKTIS